MALHGATLFWSFFLIPQNTNFHFPKEREVSSHKCCWDRVLHTGIYLNWCSNFDWDLKYIRLLVEGKTHLGKICSTGLVHQNYSHANVFQNMIKIHRNTIRLRFISSPVRNMSRSLMLIFINLNTNLNTFKDSFPIYSCVNTILLYYKLSSF